MAEIKGNECIIMLRLLRSSYQEDIKGLPQYYYNLAACLSSSTNIDSSVSRKAWNKKGL